MSYFDSNYYPHLRRQKEVSKLADTMSKVMVILVAIGLVLSFINYLFNS